MRWIKSTAERRIELATWGLLLIWAGVVLAVDFQAGVPALVTGALLLASWFIQRAIGGAAGIIYWGGGLAFALSGLSDLTGEDSRVPVFAIILVMLGAAVLVRAIATPRRSGIEIDIRSARRPPPSDDVT